MISASEFLKDYQRNDLSFFEKAKWTQVHTLISIGYGLLVVASIWGLVILNSKLEKNNMIWLIFAVLSCIIILAIAITLAIKIFMPYFMKEAEYENNRMNKQLSMAQEDFEYANLAEKTGISIIEKYAKTIIEEEAKMADSYRQQEQKQQEYHSKVADIICNLYKAYSSSQSPQPISDEQIVYQLIQSLTNKNK